MKLISALLLGLMAANAYAEDTTVGAKVSTLGLGLDVALPITQSIDGRLGFNTFNYNFNRTTTSNGLATNFTGQFKLQSFAALADYHPWDGSFRLTGGVLYNNNKFSMTSNGGNLGGAACPACTATATIDFNKAAPYLGFGWGSAAKDTGLSFAADIGVLFQGTPKANVTATGGATQAQINQANADLNSSLNNFRYYPVASIGLGYTF